MASSNRPNDWTLTVGLDISKVEKDATRISQIMQRINKAQDASGTRHKSLLNGQLKVMKTQERITNKILGNVKAINAASGRVPTRAIQAPQATRTVPARVRATTAPDISERRADVLSRVGIYDDRLGQMFQGGSEEARRGLEQTRAEVNRLRNAIRQASNPRELRRLNREFRELKARAQLADREVRRLNRTISAGQTLANGFTSSLRNMGRSVVSIYLVAEAVRTVYSQMKQLSSTRALLLGASGDAEKAANNFDFLAQTSGALGTSLLSSARGFAQLGVAGREAGLNQGQIKELFVASQEASTAFALSADEAFGVTKALVQMLSKGAVQMEELKGQMGDRMPIAVSTMAKALGVTNKELIKMIEKGELNSKEVLPKFAAGLRAAAREGGALQAGMNSINAEQNRLSTSWVNLVASFSEKGGESFLTALLRDMRDVVHMIKPLTDGLGKIVAFTSEAQRRLDMFNIVKVGSGVLRGRSTLNSEVDAIKEERGIEGRLDKGSSLYKEVMSEAAARARQKIAPQVPSFNQAPSTTSNTNSVSMQFNISGVSPQETAEEVQKVMQTELLFMAPRNY